MEALIKVEPITAEATVTKPAVMISPKVCDITKRLDTVQAPLIMQVLSIGGCSVAAIPNPDLFAKEGELVTA